MRQIVEALGIKPQFDTESTPQNLSVFTMTEYKKEFPFPVVFPPVIPNNTLAEWLSSKGLAQFHCAGMKNDVYTTVIYAQIFPATTVFARSDAAATIYFIAQFCVASI